MHETLTDPVQIMALVGLVFPEDAHDIVAERVEGLDAYHYCYRLRFEAAPEAIAKWTDSHGDRFLDRAIGFSGSLVEHTQELIGLSALPSESVAALGVREDVHRGKFYEVYFESAEHSPVHVIIIHQMPWDWPELR